LRIGTRSFAHGLGGHANSAIRVDLNGNGLRFRALVGVDAAVGPGRGSVNFRVLDGTRALWESGPRRGGDEAQAVDVDLTGIQQLTLLADDTGDGTDGDHANWAEAVVVMATGVPSIVSAPREAAVILTPPPPATPRINGPRVFGARPGHPILFRIPATGERPLTFAAEGLPAGLHLDPTSGILTGRVAQAGHHVVTLIARNAQGEATARVAPGDRGTHRPDPAHGLEQLELLRPYRDGAAHPRCRGPVLVASGLADHGWSYINLDDFWTTRDGSRTPRCRAPPATRRAASCPTRAFPTCPA
jgi:alpha-galactosidase